MCGRQGIVPPNVNSEKMQTLYRCQWSLRIAQWMLFSLCWCLRSFCRRQFLTCSFETAQTNTWGQDLFCYFILTLQLSPPLSLFWCTVANMYRDHYSTVCHFLKCWPMLPRNTSVHWKTLFTFFFSIKKNIDSFHQNCCVQFWIHKPADWLHKPGDWLYMLAET